MSDFCVMWLTISKKNENLKVLVIIFENEVNPEDGKSKRWCKERSISYDII